MNAITDKQRAVLAFVEAFIERHGYPPTTREIGKAFRYSSYHAAHCHIVALEKKGYLHRVPHVSRGLQVIRRRFAEEGSCSK